MTILSIINFTTEIATNVVSATCEPGQVPTAECIDAAVKDSGTAFKVASALFRFVGIAVIIFTLVSVVKALVGLKTAEALKKLIGGILAAVLCFNLALPLTLIEGFGAMASKILEQVNDVISDNSK